MRICGYMRNNGPWITFLVAHDTVVARLAGFINRCQFHNVLESDECLIRASIDLRLELRDLFHLVLETRRHWFTRSNFHRNWIDNCIFYFFFILKSKRIERTTYFEVSCESMASGRLEHRWTAVLAWSDACGLPYAFGEYVHLAFWWHRKGDSHTRKHQKHSFSCCA